MRQNESLEHKLISVQATKGVRIKGKRARKDLLKGVSYYRCEVEGGIVIASLIVMRSAK